MTNQENIAEYANVIKAFSEGCEIQWMNIHDGTWNDWPECADIPEYNYVYRYRVKPKIMFVRFFENSRGELKNIFYQKGQHHYISPDCTWVSEPVEVELY